MWLFDNARYGRLLAGAAVLFSLLACEHQRPRTTEDAVAATKAVQPADSSAPEVLPAAPMDAAPPDVPTENTGPSVPEITDRTSTDTLATWSWNTAQWDSLNADWDKWKDIYATTRLGRFRLVEGHEVTRLFYRVTAHDSTWTEIDLALSREDADIQWGMESGGTELNTVDLDGRGSAELVLRFRPASYGSGGGTTWDHVSVLDVSANPRLIFRALLATEFESFAGYATMHGYKLEPGEEFTGCKRSFAVRGHELMVGQDRR